MNCVPSITKHIEGILLYSGRNFNRVGQYQSCIDNPLLDYKQVYLSLNDTSADLPIFLGMCLPAQCTAYEVKSFLNLIIRQNQINVTVTHVDEHIQDISYPYGIYFFFTVLMLSVLLSLLFVASCSKTVGRHKTLSAFSLKNSMKVFEYKNNKLNTLNGVRALAMLWVIYGHANSFILSYTSNSLASIQSKEQSWPYLITQGGLFAVDTFFFIGGFLASYAVLKQASRSVAKYPLAILNRWLRLVPAYFVAIMVYYSIFMHLGSGPYWAAGYSGVKFCDTWWRPLLFIDNLVNNGDTQCMGWGWYLQNDMQIFVYCMLILLVYGYSKLASYFMIFFSIAASWAYFMQQTYDHKFHNLMHMDTDFDTYNEYMEKLYFTPWARCPPYLYGIFLGMLYTEFLYQEHKENSQNILVNLRNKFQSNVWFRRGFELSGYLISAFFIIILRTGQNDHYWSQLTHSLYLTYAKTGFVVGVSFIIFPSLLGIENSLVRFMMDTKFFNFIAKISYCTYLVHLIVIFIILGAIKSDYYFTVESHYVMFVSYSVLSMFFGLLLTIMVQIPFAKLQKHLMNILIGRNKELKHQSVKSQPIQQKLQETNQALNGKHISQEENKQQLKNDHIVLNETVHEQPKSLIKQKDDQMLKE